MIEFCPGGAVDATMLGRPLALFLLLHFCILCSLPVTRIEFLACGTADTTPELGFKGNVAKKMPKCIFLLKVP